MSVLMQARPSGGLEGQHCWRLQRAKSERRTHPPGYVSDGIEPSNAPDGRHNGAPQAAGAVAPTSAYGDKTATSELLDARLEPMDSTTNMLLGVAD